MEFIETKTILQRATHGEEWFGIDYNMNLYKGCCHKCIYCDSRRDYLMKMEQNLYFQWEELH